MTPDSDSALREAMGTIRKSGLTREKAEPKVLFEREATMKRRGFTLVEMLVTLAIITVLAALLFTVFSRVRESGRLSGCQSNLKQIAIAMQQYVADADGHYPTFFTWHDKISPYLKSAAVFRCPTQQRDSGNESTDYKYNTQRLNSFIPNRFIKGEHEANLSLSATIVLNSERGWLDSSNHPTYGDYPVTSSCGRLFEGSSLHSGGSNYSFLDGHVKWLTPKQMAEIECSNGPLPFPFKD